MKNKFIINDPDFSDLSFQGIIDKIPGLFGFWNQELINIFSNDTYAHYFQKSPEEIKGLHIKDVLGTEQFKKVSPYITEVLKGESQAFETNMTYQDGTKHDVLVNYIPYKSKNSVKGFFVIITNITDLKKQALEIESQKIFYSNVLNTMTEGFVVQAEDARILYFNEAATKILGLTADQLLGKTSFDHGWQAIKENGENFPGEEHPAVVTIKTKTPYLNVTMGIKTTHKETRWLKINAIPFYSQFGLEKSAVMATFRDVTSEFKREKIISATILNSPGMIYQYQLKADGTICFPYLSPRVHELFEITRKELEQNPNLLFNKIHKDDIASLEKNSNISAQTLNHFNWKGRIVTGLGKIKWISIKSIPRKEHDGCITWEGIMTDVTAEEDLLHQLNLERVRLVHAEKLASLGEVSAGVAHEIQNPLAIITGMTNLLGKYKNDPEKFSHKISQINNAAVRINKIVSGLKRFARLNNESFRKLQMIKNILNDLNTLVDVKAKYNSTAIILNINTESQIICDSIEIEQVLINLINNGIDAVKLHNPKWVKVEAFDDTMDVVIRVTDAGQGIPEMIIDKLFDPFFTTKVVGEGTGLGLSISQGIIKDHGGDLIYNKNFPNTCFEIRLPIANAMPGF